MLNAICEYRYNLLRQYSDFLYMSMYLLIMLRFKYNIAE